MTAAVDAITAAKQNAAKTAAQYVQSDSDIGVGSGSTVFYFIETLEERINSGELENVHFVATSFDSELMLRARNMAVVPLERKSLTLVVDGADEVNQKKQLIKGGGAALLREKIVYFAAQERIIIVDNRKIVAYLGKTCPLPLEIAIFGYQRTIEEIQTRWPSVKTTLRMGKAKLGPVITDNGNFIVDAQVGEIADPELLESELHKIPGILATGLFTLPANKIIVGYHDRTEIIDIF